MSGTGEYGLVAQAEVGCSNESKNAEPARLTSERVVAVEKFFSRNTNLR